MKTVPASIRTQLDSAVSTLCYCLRLTRADDVVMGFTDHDQDVVVDSVTYQAETGGNLSAIAAQDGLAVDNLELAGFLDSAAITEDDIRAGVYDFAAVEVFQVDYANPAGGRMILRTGHVGEVSSEAGTYKAEVRGLLQAYSQQIVELFSPACRADLGDSRCKVDLAGFTVTGSVTSLTDNRRLADTARTESDGYFTFGKITFNSGENAGLSMEVKAYTVGNLELTLPMPRPLAIGDTYTLVAGCDKSLNTCINRFNNLDNMRAEPYLPGINKALQYP